MSVDWADYEPYQPPHAGLLSELSRREARDCFEAVMAAKDERIDQLRQLIEANGGDLGTDDQSLNDLNQWFDAELEASPDDPRRLRNIWYAVAHDIALFLGDILIARAPGLNWTMCSGGKKNVSYQRQVVSGFTKTTNSSYFVDYGLMVAGEGQSIIRGNPPRHEFFSGIVRSAVELA